MKLKQSKVDLSNFSVEQTVLYGQYLEKKYNSDNSRRRRVQTLRIFFDFLVSKGMYGENPIRKIPSSPKFLDIPRPTTLIEAKTLWQYLLEGGKDQNGLLSLSAKRNQVIFLLVYGAALKVSDLSQLKKDHIFIGQENGPRVLITGDKRDPYTIELPPIFTRVYLDYMEELIIEKEKARLDFDQVLFNANPYQILSGGLSPRGLEMVFEDLRKKLMITLTPKSLRQACIFKWLHEGHQDVTIKEWMGVAPSYSLKLYKDHKNAHIYESSYMQQIYDSI